MNSVRLVIPFLIQLLSACNLWIMVIRGFMNNRIRLLNFLAFLFLILVQQCSTKRFNNTPANENYLFDVHENKVDKYDSTSLLFRYVENALRKANKPDRHYRIYKYWDVFLLVGRYGTNGRYFHLFYSLKNDSIMQATERYAYNYFKDKDITSIDETKDLLEHMLILERPGSSIVNGWGDFYKQCIEPYPRMFNNKKIESIKNSIVIKPPAVLQCSTAKSCKRHVFYVYKPTFNNFPGAVYIYEISVVKNRIQGEFEKKVIIDIGYNEALN